MKELSAFERINLLKCCDIGSRMTHFGLPWVKEPLNKLSVETASLRAE
jgi:hypothetical protein